MTYANNDNMFTRAAHLAATRGERAMNAMPSSSELDSSIEFYLERTSQHSASAVVELGRIVWYAPLRKVDGVFSTIVSTLQGKQLDHDEIVRQFDLLVVVPVSRFARYDSRTQRLLMRDESGIWNVVSQRCEPLDPDAFSRLLAMLYPQIFTPLDALSRRCAKLLIDAVTKSVEIDMARIQFGDCVLTHEGVVPASSDVNAEPPTFVSSQLVKEFASTRAYTRKVAAVDDLLSHVTGGDGRVLARLLDKFAEPLILNFNVRDQSQEFVFLYGQGGTGKSTILDLVDRAYGADEMSAVVTLSKLQDFRLEQVIGKLVLIDTDCSNGFIEAGPSDNIKKLTAGDKLEINRKGMKVISYRARACIFAAGNELPRSADKTNGWFRRLELYNVDNVLVRDSAWWAELNSSDAARYMLELLIERAIDLTLGVRPYYEPAGSMLELKDEYIVANDSVAQWLQDEAGGRYSTIIYTRPKDAFKEYESWCETTSETPCGKRSFIGRIRTSLRLVVKTVVVSPTNHEEIFTRIQLETPTPIEQSSVHVKLFVPADEM